MRSTLAVNDFSSSRSSSPVTTSASIKRTPANSRARNSVSAWVLAATSRSLSDWVWPRRSWRFWASRISGAAYEA